MQKFDTIKFEDIIGRRLEEDELNKISLWEKGRALDQLTRMPVWQVVLEMLQDYPVKALKELALMDPSGRDNVAAQQAVAYAANRIFTAFQEDVDQAIAASKEAPSFVVSALKGIRNPVLNRT